MYQKPEQNQNTDQTLIQINFGQPIPLKKLTPFDISLKFYLNESNQKLKNVKFNFQQLLKIEVPINSILLEVPVIKGDPQSIANKLKPQNNEQVNNFIINNNLTTFKAIPDFKSNKVIVILHGQNFDNGIGVLSSFADNIQNNNQQNKAKIQQALEFQIQSWNSLQAIIKMTNQKHGIRAILDSLQLRLSFNYSKNVVRFLRNIFESVGPSQLSPMFQAITESYQRTSLKIKCSSSRYLEQHASWNEYFKPSKLGQSNSHMVQIEKLLKDTGQDIKIYIFGEEVGISGSMHIEGPKNFLSLFSS